MFSTKSIFAATAAFSLISSSAATYDASSKSNVALYWGQGANQQDLRVFCDESSVDIIPIAFINVFPDQGNGLIGENFGNKCWGSQPPGNAASYYQGPGNDPSENQLPYQCPTVQDDIPYCQAQGKKILLSLGGASATYALTGVDEGIALADFLWGAYGPLTPEWTAAGGIRPLDRSSSNTSTSPEYQIDIDGFDFDIEYPSADAQAGYIACIDRLRENFAQNPSKQYIISGAPQCPMLAQNGFQDANMGNMILASQFDVIWIQFYNNGQAGCTARNWADANPNYPTTQSSTTTLNYQAWKNTINSGASNGAQIYLGLLAGPVTDCATPAGYGDFLNATEADHLISAFQGDDQFGGVMLWEATSALNDCECGTPYFDTIKNSLNKISPPKDCSTVTSSTISSSSSSSTSAPVSTTSSSLISSSSSSVPASTTSSSAPVSTSSSSSPVASSSSVSPTATPIPTTVPSVGTCVHIGCYSEATNSRALVPGALVDYDSMSVEKCADYCKDYTMFGVEYGGECYCGNSLQPGSVLEPAGDCNQVCDGTPTEICGAGNRLDIYSCGSSLTSTSVSSTQSSSSSVLTTSSASPTISTTSSVVSSSSSVVSSNSSSVSVETTSSQTSSVVPTTSSSVSSTESSTSSSVPTLSSTSSIVPVSNTSSYIVPTTSSSSVSSTLSSTSSIVPVSNTSSSVVPTTSSSSVVVPTSSSSILTTSSSSSSTFLTLPPYTNSTRTATPTSSSSVELASSVVSTSSTGSVEPTTSSLTSSVTPSGSSTENGVPTSSAVSPSETSTTSGVFSSIISPSETSTTDGFSSSTVSPSDTATDNGVPTSTDVPWTTSTVYTTSVYTITSCAPTVTNCPARIGSVTTEVISLYTTVCPVTQTQGNGGSPAGPTGTPAPPSPPSQPTEVTKYTTSTVYTTKVYTVTSCAPTVTNCPAKLGSVTTEIISLYTTVCPVANQTPGSAGSSPSAPAGPKSSAPGGSVPASSAPAVVPSSPAGGKGSSPSSTTTTHVKHTKTTYVTIAFATSTGTIPSAPQSPASNSGAVSAPQSSASNSGVVSVVPSTMTVIPLPPTTAAPYPTGPSSKNKHHGTGTGTGLPSVSVVYTKQVEVSPVPVSVVKGQQSAVSTPASVPSVKATPVPSQFQGAAGRVGGSFGIVSAIALGAIALLL